MKKISILFLLLSLLFSCGENNKMPEIENENIKINIIASIIPLASISNYIGGEYVDVDVLIPSGVSPHNFDLKPKQIINIKESDLIVSLGLEHIDGFLEKIIGDKKNIVVSSGISLLDGDEEEHAKDPHIWTNSENAIKIAKIIKDQLSEINPEKKEYFEKNYNDFSTKLNKILKEYKKKINGKKENSFILFHDAYNYLLKELNINQNNIIIFQKRTVNNSSSSEMKDFLDEIKNKGVTIAFSEPQFNDSDLQKISNDYNIQISTLDPLGTDTSKIGFINNYKDSLNKLIKIYE